MMGDILLHGIEKESNLDGDSAEFVGDALQRLLGCLGQLQDKLQFIPDCTAYMYKKKQQPRGALGAQRAYRVIRHTYRIC